MLIGRSTAAHPILSLADARRCHWWMWLLHKSFEHLLPYEWGENANPVPQRSWGPVGTSILNSLEGNYLNKLLNWTWSCMGFQWGFKWTNSGFIPGFVCILVIRVTCTRWGHSGSTWNCCCRVSALQPYLRCHRFLLRVRPKDARDRSN